jgi:6-pyruvoyltetrahydropterin/6-carboxytetrahydropterin synthase
VCSLSLRAVSLFRSLCSPPLARRVSKEDFKFSAAHFIVHASSRERLHGHNYRVAVDVRGVMHADGSGYLVDFAVVKRATREVCAALDERFLCPARNAHLAVSRSADGASLSLRVAADGALFVLPADDVVLLPVPNITVEALANELACRIVSHAALAQYIGGAITQFSVAVTETPGQTARCTHDAAALLCELAAMRRAEEARDGGGGGAEAPAATA